MNPTSQDVGMNIRRLRKEQGLTLAKLAGKCHCSSSLLSQIETGTVNPSFSTLKAVSDALGIAMASLFEVIPSPDETSVSLMRPKERTALSTKGGVRFELLSRGIDFPCEFILNRWPPGSSTGKELYNHEGEECGLLIEGELVVETNGKAFHMKPGDSITINSSAPHRVTNSGNRSAVAVWVNSVPLVFAIK